MRIGNDVIYIGAYHAFATNQRVKVKAIIRGEDLYLTSNEELDQAGGVKPGDRVEFQPYIQAHNGEMVPSFVTSDASLMDFVEESRLLGF